LRMTQANLVPAISTVGTSKYPAYHLSPAETVNLLVPTIEISEAANVNERTETATEPEERS
jgi:hypothetical protein